MAALAVRLLAAPSLRSPRLRSQLGRSRSVAVRSMERIDSHLHVWAAQGETDKFPYKDLVDEAPVPANVELLLDAMDVVNVKGALIVQSSTHGFDHSYVTNVMKTHPGKFVGCLLANPAESGEGIPAMEELVQKDGYQCVRFNPYIWPDQQKMTNEVGQALYKKAGELGVPVGYMAFEGLLRHIEEIETLLELYPETKVIIDHFGFCKCSEPDSESWKKLLALAKFPQVYVKTSAFFRVSSESYPYLDSRQPLRKLVDTFGPEKLMWGTDFPWVTQECGYTKAWTILEDGDKSEGKPLLSEEETQRILGGTVQNLFPSGWK